VLSRTSLWGANFRFNLQACSTRPSDTEIQVCLDFVKVFGNLSHVKSLRLLDDSFIKELTAARNLLNDKKYIALLKKIHTTNYKDIKLQCVSTKRKTDGSSVTETLDSDGSFLVQLGKVFGDIRDAFPPQSRDSKLDLVCELKTGEYNCMS
jgi:hypothetical protein